MSSAHMEYPFRRQNQKAIVWRMLQIRPTVPFSPEKKQPRLTGFPFFRKIWEEEEGSIPGGGLYVESKCRNESFEDRNADGFRVSSS